MRADELHGRLSEAGFHLVAEGVVGPYNDELRELDAGFVLPDFGRRDARVVLIGNGAELFDAIREAAREDEALRLSRDPIDHYAKTRIEAILRESETPHELRFTFDAPPRAFAAVRLARALGLAEMGPSMLAIHPERGPYIALRAAIVFDEEGEAPMKLEGPCARCEARPCVPAMNAALEAVGGVKGLNRASIKREVEAMLRARTACPVGEAHRYPEPLLRYHYLHDPELLFGGIGR